MGELTFAAAVLVWGLLPGVLLLSLAGVNWSRVERAAAAAGLSPAVAAAAAYVAEVAGLPIRPIPVFAVIFVLCAIVFALRRKWGAAASAADRDWPVGLSRWLAWVPWLVWLLPLAVIAQLYMMSDATLLPPTLHDGLDHANWFRLIYETASLDPNVVRAPPLTAAGEPTLYPWGLHAWAALLAHTSTIDPVVVWMRAMVLVSAALPLSVYVFIAQFTGRGWTAIAASVFSLLFWWVPYQMWGWGGYALLAGAMAVFPLTRLALSAAERSHVASIAAAAICAAGILVIHPSQLFVVLITSAAIGVTLAAGGALSWRAAALLAGAFAVAIAGLVIGAGVWQPLADFFQRARDVSVAMSVDPRYRWPIGTLFDTELPLPYSIRAGLGALTAVGAAASVMQARLRPLIVLHLLFGALVLVARHQTWLTVLWYHLPERIWYEQAATVPALAAVGLAAGVQLVTRAARRWIDLSRWAILIWPLAIASVFLPLHKRYEPWASRQLYQAAYRNPQLAITDWRVLGDFAWMRANIPRGEILFNAPADWGLSLPFTGHRTVFWSGGSAIDPSTPWNDLIALMQRGDPHASQAAAEVSARGIHYVYAARLSPMLERRGRQPLDGSKLVEAPAFETLYESDTARIFRIPDVRGTLAGLRDSDRIRFEGFYRPEQLGRHAWRWTAGRGRLFLNARDAEGAECFVRVFGPAPGQFEVRRGDGLLELTERGYRVLRAPGDHTIELEIVSPTFTPPAGTDDRVLGVRVTDVGFACPTG